MEKVYYLDKTDLAERFDLSNGEFGDYCILTGRSENFLEQLKLGMEKLGYTVKEGFSYNNDKNSGDVFRDEQTVIGEILI